MLILINPSAVRQEHVFNRCVDGPKLVAVSSFGAIKLPVTFLFRVLFCHRIISIHASNLYTSNLFIKGAIKDDSVNGCVYGLKVGKV